MSSAYLVVPQVAYGWDLDLIRSELNKMWTGESRGHWGVLTVEIINPNPSVILHLFSNNDAAPRHQLPLAIATLVLLVTGTLCVVAFVLHQAILGWLSLAVSVLLIGFRFSVRIFTKAFSKKGVDDSIGIAWALKGWTFSGIPSSFSKTEALEEMRKADSTLGAVPDERIVIQRRANGWYRLVGVREGDWLKENKANLAWAINNYRSCILVSSRDRGLMSQIANGRGVLEGDDPIGI